MITRKISGSHICLRCRYALAKRSTTSSVHQIRYASGNSSPVTHNYSVATKEELERNNYRNRSSRRESRFAGDNVHAQPFGKLYGHHGHSRRAGIEDLNTKSLEDPAKAIVLRDTIFNFYTYDKVTLKPQLAEHIDIEQQLKEERGLVSQDEVNENITSFKPKFGQEPSSWDDINVLVRKIQSGFTTSQLEKYIKTYNRSASDINEVPWEVEAQESAIVRSTAWLPGTSDAEHLFDDDPMRGYFLDSHTNKQRVVLRLIRNCWQVELPELAEGIGQFEIEVKPQDLELLLAGSPSPLEQMCSRDLTFEHEKMEVYRPRNVLRVTTLQHKRSWIVSEIEAVLSTIEREIIDLRQVVLPKTPGYPYDSASLSQRIDQPILDELGRLTETSILKKDSNLIEVSYLRDAEPLNPSSKTNDVRRLLVTSISSPIRVKTQLAHAMPDTLESGYVKCSPFVTKSLPWYDRCRSWSRWTAPTAVLNTPKKTAAQDAPDRNPQDFEVPTPSLAIPEQRITTKQDSEKPEGRASGKVKVWNQRYFTETSALIGNILHEETTSGEETSWAPKMEMQINDPRHTFSTHIPNLSGVLSSPSVKIRNSGEITNVLILRFSPNPFFMPAEPQLTRISKRPLSVGPYAISAFPPIEMRFNIDSATKATKLKDIRALVWDTRTDVMLPDHLVDARFEQLTISRLTQRYLKQVKQYIKDSKIDFESGVIEPFPTIKFPISDHLIMAPGSKILGFGQDAKVENREIEYLYAGLEIRSSLEYSWDGWLLQYTSIKGGRAAGSRAELRLLPIKDGERVNETPFVMATYRLADVLGGGNPNTALDSLPKIPKPVRVMSAGFDLTRRKDTMSGTVRMKFDYFARYLDINTVLGNESDIVGSKSLEDTKLANQSTLLDSEEDEGDNEDHEKEQSEDDSIDLAYKRELGEDYDYPGGGIRNSSLGDVANPEYLSSSSSEFDRPSEDNGSSISVESESSTTIPDERLERDSVEAGKSEEEQPSEPTSLVDDGVFTKQKEREILQNTVPIEIESIKDGVKSSKALEKSKQEEEK